MTAAPAPLPRTVAILGGGLSGAAVAWHLARHDLPLRIVVVEPRPALGAGLAYSACDPDHRLNVPDAKMTLRTDRPDDYARWLNGRAQAGDIAPNGDIFTARARFGAYVADQMTPLLRGGRVIHLRHSAEAVETRGARHVVVLSDGSRLAADVLVLALSHPKAFVPPELAPLAADPRLIADPFAPGALTAIDPAERVAIIGNGLTAADVLATLARQGGAGPIVALSRHGWLSQPHGPKQAESTANFAQDPAETALSLLRRVRAALRDDARRGLTWHACFDRLRAQGPAIWAALPPPERLRFLRHLRALWDIHRFRIAPQTAAAAAGLAARGRLQRLAARLVSVQDDGALSLTIRPRGQPGLRHLAVDRIVLATGPHHASVLKTTPVLASLVQAGLIAPDPTGLGIATAATGHAIATAGQAARVLVAGPLARGTVGELMGVPEVVAWAEHIAATLAQDFAPRLQGASA